MPQRFEQELEGCGISKGSGLSYEEKFLLIESLVEKVEKLSAEDDTEGFDMEEEVFAGRSPAVLIERQSSCGDQDSGDENDPRGFGSRYAKPRLSPRSL